MSKVIVFATPVFLLMIALEYLWGRRRAARGTGTDTYRLNDALNSISLGVLSQLSAAMSKLLTIGIYTSVFAAVALYPQLEFWNTWYGWLIALVFYDFCYYWLHRAGHEVAVCWAFHVVHHQSQQYNLSTALRQTSSGALLGWIFYLPMAVAGVPPQIFAVVAIIDLLYQFWYHTEHVGKLGWFDRVWGSPSNHRVHHAVNAQYLDRNYGGMLMLWDHLFGSFQEETEPCVYGTRSPLRSWDPLWANAEVYWTLARDAWRTERWADKLRVWFMPPGWQPADLAAADPKPVFRLEAVTPYDPPLTRAQQWFAALQFVVSLGAVSVFLWSADSLAGGEAAVWVAAITAAMWAQGLFLQGRLAMAEVLLLECAVLATLAAAGMLGLPGGFDPLLLFKPLPMAIAILFVAPGLGKSTATGLFEPKTTGRLLLLAALAFALAGDIALMLPGDHFVTGLGLFLVTHLLYLALFRQGAAWFPQRAALWGSLALGALMYALLWQPLAEPVLRLAVAAYITAICLMVAQALGCASATGDSHARWAAAGACVFMASDTLIAVDRFLTPLPWAPVWILTSYFAAQMLIVHHGRWLYWRRTPF